MAVLSVLAAIIIAELMSRLLHAEPSALLMLFCAIIVVAWLGGLGPALLAVTLALLAFHYYLVPPINTFAWKQNVFAVAAPQFPPPIFFWGAMLFFLLRIFA